jgi:hypothetical protein
MTLAGDSDGTCNNMDTWLALAHSNSHCLLQTGRKELREMFLQNHKFSPTSSDLNPEKQIKKGMSSYLSLQTALIKVSLYLSLRVPREEK